MVRTVVGPSAGERPGRVQLAGNPAGAPAVVGDALEDVGQTSASSGSVTSLPRSAQVAERRHSARVAAALLLRPASGGQAGDELPPLLGGHAVHDGPHERVLPPFASPRRRAPSSGLRELPLDEQGLELVAGEPVEARDDERAGAARLHGGECVGQAGALGERDGPADARVRVGSDQALALREARDGGRLGVGAEAVGLLGRRDAQVGD